MAILNENLDWGHLGRSPDVRDAFLGVPAKTLIPAGQLLCRFITTKSKVREDEDSGIYSSPWWTDWSATAALLDRWKSARIKPKDVLRGKLAITHEFSTELDSLVQIILTLPVYAWKGIARYQEDKSLKVTYLGGAEQFFLPNLAGDPDRPTLVPNRSALTSKVAYLHCFSSVDMLI